MAKSNQPGGLNVYSLSLQHVFHAFGWSGNQKFKFFDPSGKIKKIGIRYINPSYPPPSETKHAIIIDAIGSAVKVKLDNLEKKEENVLWKRLILKLNKLQAILMDIAQWTGY